ncbi:MAG: family N-acetyltransferase [Alphaproteobacteria bacterium]|nr:family N-acetyltransferase [Alphaproteobacteria bacterium]
MTDLAKHKLAAQRIEKLNHADMTDLCDATIAAIEKDGGFGWVTVPERDVLERYWKGVLAVNLRDLFVVRLDGAIAGTAQLIKFPPNNQAQSFSAQLTTFFIAPWARGFGLGEMMIDTIEQHAKSINLNIINLDVRETQFNAIKLFRKMGYVQWGMNPYYAMIDTRIIPGYFFHKIIQPLPSITPIET